MFPPNANETKRNNMLIPIKGLQFSTFLINVLFLKIILVLLLILSVSISHSLILIYLANLFSHLQLLTLQNPFLHFFTIKHSHLHLFLLNF